MNDKIKKEPGKLELDINVAKDGQLRVFPRQAANSAVWRENPLAVDYCWPWLSARWNRLGTVVQVWNWTVTCCDDDDDNDDDDDDDDDDVVVNLCE